MFRKVELRKKQLGIALHLTLNLVERSENAQLRSVVGTREHVYPPIMPNLLGSFNGPGTTKSLHHSVGTSWQLRQFWARNAQTPRLSLGVCGIDTVRVAHHFRRDASRHTKPRPHIRNDDGSGTDKE
jgi:hypothetical protein